MKIRTEKIAAVSTPVEHAEVRSTRSSWSVPYAPAGGGVVKKASEGGGTSPFSLRLWTGLKSLAGDGATIRRAEKIVAEIEKRSLATMSDDAIATRMDALRAKPRDERLTEVFALSSEACARWLGGKRPYSVQLLAGVLLSQGKIVEQYTGEGKTITAIAHAANAALDGKGVYVATANNYLAKRDAIETAPAYHALGLTVAALTPDGAVLIDANGEQRTCSRKLAYEADIVYGTTAEFAFDQLRDELAEDRDARVQRDHGTLILDEVDALLIDDARTPFIISGPGDAPDQETWAAISAAVESVPEELIQLDRSAGWAILTDEGHDFVMNALGIEDPSLRGDDQLNRMIWNAVRARELFENGKDYLVENGEIVLLHKNGEKTPGRRLVRGLHQAIEAREGVTVREESRATNQTTMRELLASFEHVSGMTGTAETSEKCFVEVYGLDVVRVPTRRPMLRRDEPTKLFATIEDKANAIVADAISASKRGQPVLIGVPDERTADALSSLFAAEGIKHACLTAKDDEKEAQVIAGAGKPGAITIATPKGGRGVHFALGGGNAEERAAVLREGGLLVLGFSHHDSERRDNQLRGRAARQGEPGWTRFYASLEDLFFQHSELPAWTARGANGVQSDRVTALIADHLALGERKLRGDLLKAIPFDNIAAEHRRRFVEERELALETKDLFGEVRSLAEEKISRILQKKHASQMDLYRELKAVLPLVERTTPPPSWKGLDAKALQRKILEQLTSELDRALESFGDRRVRNFVLETFSAGFSEHLEQLQIEREMLPVTTTPGSDPHIAFALKSGELWDALVAGIRGRIARALLAELPPMALR